MDSNSNMGNEDTIMGDTAPVNETPQYNRSNEPQSSLRSTDDGTNNTTQPQHSPGSSSRAGGSDGSRGRNRPRGQADSVWNPDSRSDSQQRSQIGLTTKNERSQGGQTLTLGQDMESHSESAKVKFDAGKVHLCVQENGRINTQDAEHRHLRNTVMTVSDNASGLGVLGRVDGRKQFAVAASDFMTRMEDDGQTEFSFYQSAPHKRRRREYEENIGAGKERWQKRPRQIERQIEEVSSSPIPRCANCGSSNHVLRDCVVKWSPSGDIPGCYRCNLPNHTIDKCTAQPPLNRRHRYNIEVVGRIGRPPLRSIQGWNSLAEEFGHDANGPISRQSMIEVPPNYFRQWDYKRTAQEQAHLLFNDPLTANLAAIKVLPDQGYIPAGPQLQKQHEYNQAHQNQAQSPQQQAQQQAMQQAQQQTKREAERQAMQQAVQEARQALKEAERVYQEAKQQLQQKTEQMQHEAQQAQQDSNSSGEFSSASYSERDRLAEGVLPPITDLPSSPKDPGKSQSTENKNKAGISLPYAPETKQRISYNAKNPFPDMDLY